MGCGIGWGVLALALAATLTGARSFTAIAEWAADAPETVLAQLGIVARVPSESTIRRILGRLAADRLDEVIGAWMWLRTSVIDGRRVIAFDGKTVRGARDAAGNLAHLLAGLCQRTGVVLAQIAVGAKTNEIPVLQTLLATLDLAGAIVTADAMHCQRETAQAITNRCGHYILTVKGNQPTLRKRVKSLPWKDIRALPVTREHGHGRQDTRTLKATEISAGIGFPGAAQVLRLTRTRTLRRTGKHTRKTVYAVTSLTIADTPPEQIAEWLRGHWSIENKLHWVRDVTYNEPRTDDPRRTHPGCGRRNRQRVISHGIRPIALPGATTKNPAVISVAFDLITSGPTLNPYAGDRDSAAGHRKDGGEKCHRLPERAERIPAGVAV
ncbi:ISAs1 family transposase [Nocardia sp. NPDC052278]|uniref:ISAs1 family transposase n=1 Tax=unclassified Nocardia TaxID=2637762 RepID=UPI00369F2885